MKFFPLFNIKLERSRAACWQTLVMMMLCYPWYNKIVLVFAACVGCVPLLTRRLYFQESPPVSSTAGREEKKLGMCGFSAKKKKIKKEMP